MYEDKTFENILSDLLTYVTDRYPELDTNVGSVIYNALAPVALELETVYHEMDMVVEETFVETASKEYLVKHGNQMGVELNEATYGHFEGHFNVEVEIGSRFNSDRFNYTVIEKKSDPTESNPYYVYELVCETEGSEPNSYLGDIKPITYCSGLSYAKLVSVLVYGEDEEETEAYRYRLQVHAKNPPVGGNMAQYEDWLNSYDGVGRYRIIPRWNGANTIKLVILNPENKGASDELINEVQYYFDPPTSTIIDDVNDATYPQGRGMGNGQALIGAIVTVDTVTEVPVEIDCTITLKDGYQNCNDAIDAIEKYLETIALNKTKVSYMAISAELFNADSVEDVTSLSINVGGQVMDSKASPFIDSVTLGDNQIAVLDRENSNWGV